MQTCRGSHTHSVVFEDKDRIVVYNSGTAGVRKEEELAGCIGNVPGDNRTALFRIDAVSTRKCSLVAKGDHRVHACRAPCRDVTGEERHDGQEQGNPHEGEGIVGANAIDQPGDQPG